MKKTPAKTNRKEKPEAKWQTGNYERTQEFRFRLPYGFLLLCKLWNTTPNVLLPILWTTLAAAAGTGRVETKPKNIR